MWDLSSPTRDGAHIPCIGRQILNHWTTREVPIPLQLFEVDKSKGDQVSLDQRYTLLSEFAVLLK